MNDENYGGVVLSEGRILTIGTKSSLKYTNKETIKVYLTGLSDFLDVVYVFATYYLGMLFVSSSRYQKY